MSPELLDIQPRELKFTFELKKQSLCSVQLLNYSDQYVAFKVKTTSPKRYCVRPNIGIIQPKSTCDFTVTMQAQRVAPTDMQCKDKFLIQSTVVPFGSTEEDITPSMFAKDTGKYVEEKKLRVVLISPPHSPVLLPINGALKQEPAYENSTLKDQLLSGVENLPPPVAKAVEVLKPAKDVGELRLDEDVKELKPDKDVGELRPTEVVKELKPAKDADELTPAEDVEKLKRALNVEELKLSKDIEELKSKLNELEPKLSEAEITIIKLTEERARTIQERETLQQELLALRKKGGATRVQVGFPFLFVCVVALIGVALGYLLRR